MQSTTASYGQWRQIDPIDWLLPPSLHRAVAPELHLHSANVGYKSRDLLQPVRREHATSVMPDQWTAYAATHSIRLFRAPN